MIEALQIAGLIVFGLFVVGRAVYRANFGARAVARKQLMAASASFTHGDVTTLTGTVRARETFTAALAGTPCVLDVVIADVAMPGWNTTTMVPFELVTSGGCVLVDGTTADVLIPTRPVVPRRLDREQAYFTAHELPLRALRASACEEAVVAEGEAVRVRGQIAVDGDQIRLVPPLTIDRA